MQPNSLITYPRQVTLSDNPRQLINTGLDNWCSVVFRTKSSSAVHVVIMSIAIVNIAFITCITFILYTGGALMSLRLVVLLLYYILP